VGPIEQLTLWLVGLQWGKEVGGAIEQLTLWLVGLGSG